MATPSHVDLSVLWVPIMPETSKLGPAMEDAGKSATESFDKGSAGIGEKLHDKVSHATDKLKDVFHRAGHDAGDAMSDGVKAGTDAIEKAAEDSAEKTGRTFREKFGGISKDIGAGVLGAISPDIQRQLSNRLEDVVGGAFKSVLGGDGYKGRLSELAGQGIATVFNFELDDLRQKLSDTKATVDTTKAAFASFASGDTATGIKTLTSNFGLLETTAKNFGIDVTGVAGPLQDVVNKAKSAKDNVKGFADIFVGLPGIIGKVGTAISDLAGPIATAMAAGQALDQYNLTHDPAAAAEQAARGKGMDAYSNAIAGEFNQIPGVHVNAPGAPPKPHPLPPLPPDMVMGGAAGGGDFGLGSGGSGIGGSGGFSGDLSGGAPPTVTGGAAPSGNTVPLKQNPDGTWTSPNPSWAHLLARESGGNPTIFNRTDSNAAAGDPSQGLFQFTRATWARSGGLKYGPDPSKATPQQQAEIAANLIRANPSGSDWGAGMPGRESASGLLGGLGPGGTGNSGYDSLFGGGGSAGPSGSSALAGRGSGSAGLGSVGAPTGAQHDPIYTAQADSTGGGAGAGQSQGQQLGQGLVDGLMQAVGLDGSVFKGFGGSSNPLHFGITKLATGLANVFGGMIQGQGGGAGGMGGGGGGIPGLSMLSGLGALPAGGIPQGPGGAQNVPSGDTTIHNGPVNYGPQLTVTQNGGGLSPTEDLQHTANGAGNRMPAMGTVPNAGIGPP